MVCKNIYLGQKWTSADLKFGSGTVFLAGPRNNKGKSWRIDAINKIGASGIECTIFIPEGVGQLKGGFCRISREDQLRWQRFAVSASHHVLFWFPKEEAEDIGAIDIAAWAKSDRILVGKDPENTNEKLSKFENISDSIEELIKKLSIVINNK